MEDNEVPHEIASNENPLDLFTADLDLSLDAEVRIKSIKKLTTVATALGVEKAKNDLIPYLNNLTEGIYNDDEILMNLSEQLKYFLPFVGGQENVGLIFNILEKLCAVEELVVRDKAIESLEDLSKQLDETIIENEFVPLVFRLIESDWFTSKCSGAALASICYSRGSQNTKTQLRNVYKTLCQDDSPLVRRSAASKLSDFIRVLELEYIKNEFIVVFENFAKDDQDSVRLLAIDIGITIASCLTSKEIEEVIITTLIELYADPSWRVRYQAASQITLLQKALSLDLTQKYLISVYQNLVHDSEPQVREASAKGIASFCEILQETYKEEGGKEAMSPIILNQIFPLIKILDQDCNSDVKEALSSIITSLSPLFGHENTKSLLLPLITTSLLNDSTKIKENIISNLNDIISVIGLRDIADTVLQIITDLVGNSASVWRTRRNLIVTINYIARHFGKEYFDQHLKSLYQKLLSDGVYAVRKTAPLILPILTKNFGFKWAKESILPSIMQFAEHSHYLYRYVCLFCIDELVSPTLESNFKSASSEIYQLKYLSHICNNEEGNDKIASFLNRLNVLNEDLQAKFKDDWVFDVLTHLEDNNIPSDDIKRYVEGTIDMFIKDNNLSITYVTLDEINNNSVYLEGLLEVIINSFMTVLRKLSTDHVDNVQSLVGKTLIKIEKFSSALETELKVLRHEEMVCDENEKQNEKKIDKDSTSMESEILEILEDKLKSE